MRTELRVACLVALACLAGVVAGCAGGGAGGALSTAAVSASRQSAAAIYIQEWGQILWGLRSSQTGTHPPSVTPPHQNPDRSWSYTITSADGTVTVVTVFPDSSARLDTTYPDGSTQTVQQSIPQPDPVDPSKTTYDYQVACSSGLTVQYTALVDDQGTPSNMSDDTTDMTGESVLPDRTDQHFHVFTGPGNTAVDSQQSDGSEFTMSVPLLGPRFASPDFAQPTNGTYEGESFSTQFALSSTPAASTRWASMASDLGGGVTGEFALGPDFSGNGRLLQGGQPTALLSWTRTGDIQLALLTGGSGAASPAGAAIDYLVHRWQTLAGLLGPGGRGANGPTARVVPGRARLGR